MSGKKSQQLGRIGEAEFKLLCSKQDATCNPSVEDDHGWDHIVEIAADNKQELPADLQEGVVRSLVQVKSTRSNQRKVKIKLSNALKAIQTDLPCFIVLMVFNGEELSEVLVRHFWSDDIERILKKAREAHRDKTPNLHKIHLEFSMNGFPDVQGDLVETIFSTVSEFGTNYGKEKKSIRDNVGYDDIRALAQLTFQSEVTVEDIVNLELGTISNLPLASFDLLDQRFNISTSMVNQPTAGSTISVEPKPTNGVVRLVQGTKALELEANLYSSSVIKADDPAFRMRVQTALMDFTLSPNSGNSTTTELKLEHKTLWDNYVFAELANWSEIGHISSEIICDHGTLFHGHINPKLEVNAWTKSVGAGGRIVEQIVGKDYLTTIPANEKQAVQQLSRFASLEPFFGDLLKRLTFVADAPKNLTCNFIAAFIVFELGEHFHSTTLVFPVKNQQSNKKSWDIGFGSPHLKGYKKFKSNLPNMRHEAKKELDRLVNDPGQVYITLGSGELTDWFSNDPELKHVTIHHPE